MDNNENILIIKNELTLIRTLLSSICVNVCSENLPQWYRDGFESSFSGIIAKSTLTKQEESKQEKPSYLGKNMFYYVYELRRSFENILDDDELSEEEKAFKIKKNVSEFGEVINCYLELYLEDYWKEREKE